MMAGLGNRIREGSAESHGWTWGNVLKFLGGLSGEPRVILVGLESTLVRV